MLTVFREMAHSISRHLAHIGPTSASTATSADDRAGRAAGRGARGGRSRDGERGGRANARAARGAARVRRRRRRGVRPGRDPRRRRRRAARRRDALPELPHHEPARDTRPAPRRQPLPLLHQLHRHRHRPRHAAPSSPRLEELGDSVLVVGDEATLKVHVHTDEPEAAVAALRGASATVTQLDVADMREQIAERERAPAAPVARGVVAVAAGDGHARALRGARRPRRRRRRDPQPLDLRAARRDPRGARRGGPRPAQLPERDHGRRARPASSRRSPPGWFAMPLAAGGAGGAGRARPDARSPRRTPSGSRRRWRRSAPGPSRRPPATTPRGASSRGDAVGFAERRDRRLGRRRVDAGGDDRARSPRAPRSSR